MKNPAAATSYCPPVHAIHAGAFTGRTLRHTVRERGTEDWLLMYTLTGSGLYRLDGGQFVSRPRDATLFCPGAFQDYQCGPSTGWNLLYVHFVPRPEWLSLLDWPERAPGLGLLRLEEVATAKRIVSGLREAVAMMNGSLLRRERFAQNALEEVLLWCDASNPKAARTEIDPRVRAAMDYLVSHLSQPFSEREMARCAGLSASRLRHLFRMEVGRSPREYLETDRLGRARDLLALSQLTVAEIAARLGFENPFYFSARFRKDAGESPRSFRNRIIQSKPRP